MNANVNANVAMNTEVQGEPLEPTVFVQRADVAIAQDAFPKPLVSDDEFRDRLVVQAYRRLEKRLSRASSSDAEVAAAINHYRRVVAGLLGPDALRGANCRAH
ncbi:MAG: hypothetical protein ACFCBW_05000 [Candidatus Competibacterales bacterium]